MVNPLLSLQEPLPGVISALPESSNGHRPNARWSNVFPTDNALAHYLEILSGSAVKLYLYLKKNANRRVVPEYCDRGYDRLAKDLGLSRRMVVYAEQELEAQGLLDKHAWQGRDGVNRYTFPPPTAPTPDAPKPWRRPPRRKPRHEQANGAEQAHDCTSKSAMDCTSKSAMDCTSEVQQVALSEVQWVAPIQKVSFKTTSQKGEEVDTGESSMREISADPLTPPAEAWDGSQAQGKTQADTTTHTPATWDSATPEGRITELHQAWQDICVPAGLQPATLTKTLRRVIAQALRDHPDAELWATALDYLATNPKYRTPRKYGWLTLRWLVTDDHVIDICDENTPRQRVG
jgi:hypothetical protein